jgi:hypothetical protein
MIHYDPYTVRDYIYLSVFSVDPCSSVDCHPFARCGYEATGAPLCQCPEESSCSDTQSTVCGSDGKSYKNACTLKAAVCKRKEDVNVKHSGACGKLIGLPDFVLSSRKAIST